MQYIQDILISEYIYITGFHFTLSDIKEKLNESVHVT